METGTKVLELWGGHECTVNRVGEVFRDQSVETGHQHRPEDLALFAACHIKRLRYPVLWERVCPDSPDAFDWAWTDARLEAIRAQGMSPIVGLLHHGSGPRYTSLVATDFVERFAAFARAAAERYPWVQDWTPVNEPLTTARFSALYGHWYPHAEDEAILWRALLNQIDGVRAAMAQIRQVIPSARLVQTEDLGQTLSTEPLREEAARQNERRWMTWDLLCGRVGPRHPLWPRLEAFGFGDRLRAIVDAPCPPDVIGVNHYLTSVRFLDHRRERYPQWTIEPDGHADMDAVRILRPNPVDLKSLLRQTWDRYGLPIAVTECHNGCTREEQMRWLLEAWCAALALREEGVDVRALTAWALLGAFDWDSLITKPAGHYEVGCFDVRSGRARPTAVVSMLTRLGAGETPQAVQAALPFLQTAGWWRRDIRLEHDALSLAPDVDPGAQTTTVHGPPILILDGAGGDGQAVADACELRGLAYRRTDAAEASSHLDLWRPWAVIDARGEAGDTGALRAACVDRGSAWVTLAPGAGVSALLDQLIDEAAEVAEAA